MAFIIICSQVVSIRPHLGSLDFLFLVKLAKNELTKAQSLSLTAEPMDSTELLCRAPTMKVIHALR